MAENTEQKEIKIPELVLETELDAVIPTLALTEEDVRAAETTLAQTATTTPAPPRDLEIELSPEELKVVEDFASKIDITNANSSVWCRGTAKNVHLFRVRSSIRP